MASKTGVSGVEDDRSLLVLLELFILEVLYFFVIAFFGFNLALALPLSVLDGLRVVFEHLLRDPVVVDQVLRVNFDQGILRVFWQMVDPLHPPRRTFVSELLKVDQT